MRAVLAAALVAMTACVEPGMVLCPGGEVVCPSGTTCVPVTVWEAGHGGAGEPAFPVEQFCVQPADVAACADLDRLTPCTRVDGQLAKCFDGACLPAGCGNRVLDEDEQEACDDGNALTGDGCSASCLSDETCGNGVLDPLGEIAEQCDDGNSTAHDGCSDACRPEQPQWSELEIGRPEGRAQHAMAYDAARRRFVVFGGQVGGELNGDTWESDGTGWVRIPTASGPAARAQSALAYDAARRRVVLFGGAQSGRLGDTWEWDGSTWTEIDPISSPPRRAAHAMAYDSARRRVVLFGGSANGIAPLGDTWEWDGTTWTQITTPTAPEPRSSAAMAFDPERGVMVLAGGKMGMEPVLNTWEYDGASWRIIPGSAIPPQQFVDFAMTYDHASHRVIAVAQLGFSPETWAWNGQVWTRLAVGPQPVGRRLTAMAADPVGGRIVLFGGNPQAGAALADTWQWNGSSWSEILPRSPEFFAHGAYAFDSNRGRLVGFGGLDDGNQPSNQTWELGDTSWTSATGGPSARFGSAMAYDAVRRHAVLHGGHAANLDESDTWIWDGTAWTNVAAGPPRFLHALAYDPIRDRVVLFGGTNNATPSDETWEWNGSTWSLVATTVRPLARYGHTLTYDPVRQRVVLVGGTGLVPTQLEDMWEWDGATWTEVTSAFPATLDGHGVVWAASRRRLTLFGGSAAASIFDTTLERAPLTWEIVSPFGTPPSRAGHASASTSDGSGVIIVGGALRSVRSPGLDPQPAAFSDVWRLRYDSASSYEICAGEYDSDGDSLSGCADPDCWAVCTPLCPPGATLCKDEWPHCGDLTCNSALENCRNCPSDCTCATVCGDFFCDPGETTASCPGDCS